jgi:hypothetical protein
VVAVIVAAHQPTYLPGVSVVAKLAKADAVIWLDDVRFTTPGWVNRNQLPDGRWLTVPVERRDHRTAIRDVAIADDGGRWRVEHFHALADHYRGEGHYDREVLGVYEDTELAGAGKPIADMSLALTSRILAALGLNLTQWRQSEVDVSSFGPLSVRLARLVAAIGGTAYLAPARARLERDVFEGEGVELLTFDYAGENPSVIDPLFRLGRLPTGPRQEVSAA